MKIINTNENNFKNEFNTILQRAKSDIKGVSQIVTTIIDEIIEDGNEEIKQSTVDLEGYLSKAGNAPKIEAKKLYSKEEYEENFGCV